MNKYFKPRRKKPIRKTNSTDKSISACKSMLIDSRLGYTVPIETYNERSK